MGPTVHSQRDHYSRAEFLHALAALEATIAGADTAAAAGWLARAAELRRRLDAREARVAVVGPVKSGKSTLVNALVGHDLLPRGAGVLTAQVTEVRRGARPGVTLEWLSPAEVDAEFTRLLGLLRRPGTWSLAVPEQRAAVAARTSAPATATLAALLTGYADAEPRLGRVEAQLPLPADGVARWVARDEVAQYLRAVQVTTPAATLPEGLVLLDCQGYDGWNPCHGIELLSALQAADAVVYVVSSRVGLRDADQRLLEQLQGLGLLGLTRFVLNVDWGELRDPAALRRVQDTVERRLAALGATPPVAFSALQALLERLALVAPQGLRAGERRLLDAWDADCSAGMAGGREAFAGFCAALWRDATEERDAVVLRRLRADLRGLLVTVSLALRPAARAGLQRVAWEDDAADRTLHWAQQRLAETVQGEQQSLLRTLRREFAGRRAPQQRVWQQAVAGALAPLALGADLHGAAVVAVGRSETLRVNAVRNLALVARGALARQGEALAREMAAQLAQAGLAPGVPPSRAALSREITVTRQIPLFSSVASGILRAAAAPFPGFHGLASRLSRAAGGGRPAAVASRAARATAQALAKARQARAWEHYLEQVRAECLLPHIEEAAAAVYSHLAVWVLEQLRGPPGDAKNP